MSWDIYGNSLRSGYCEVHPDVHQEYPCSICMASRQQHEQPHDELEQLKHDFAQQGDYIRHLEAQRNELAAQVDVLRRELQSAADWFSAYWPELNKAQCDRIKQMDCVVKSTPAACLAHVRAEAGRAGFICGLRLRSKGVCLDFDAAADDYAERIRQEVK